MVHQSRRFHRAFYDRWKMRDLQAMGLCGRLILYSLDDLRREGLAGIGG